MKKQKNLAGVEKDLANIVGRLIRTIKKGEWQTEFVLPPGNWTDL